MPDAVIVATGRTPIGRAMKGSLIDCRPDDLTAQPGRAIVIPLAAALLMFALGSIGGATALAQGSNIALDRDGRTIVLEPYAPNILRVTMSKTNAMATTPPGYGFVGTPSMTG